MGYRFTDSTSLSFNNAFASKDQEKKIEADLTRKGTNEKDGKKIMERKGYRFTLELDELGEFGLAHCGTNEGKKKIFRSF